jgi:class 3 adenylate cyclase
VSDEPPVLERPDERRHLTVMFSDLVGSTELASALDPEDLHDVIEAYQRTVGSVVEAHGGVVAQFQGDGLVAYFGYPQATESAGREAVTAALAITDAVSHLARELPASLGLDSLAARVGVHTGEVVMAAARLGGTRQTPDVFGEVPNLAARLQSVGSPGDVIVSDVTARLVTGYFVMEPMGALPLKGINRQVPAFRVLRRSAARRRLETGPLTGFVARPRESEWLRAHWESVQEGPARAVLVTGEPGIGKSRLLQEFTGSLSSRGAPVAPLYCGRRDALSPLRPFGPLMGDVPVAPRDAVEWVMHRADEGPLLLLLEDAHWADPSTIEAIEEVARSDRPVLEVLTARPEFNDRPPMEVPHRWDLDRLRPEDALSVIARVPGADELPEGVRLALVERADGVPLYLEELTRSVMDGTSDPATGAGIPPTLSEVIAARLDRLGAAKHIAQTAAIIGRAFDRQILQAVSGLDGETLDAHLHFLVDQAVVEVPDEGDGRWWFRHALIHEAAYRSVLRAERRRAHSQVADELVAARVHETQPEAVAFHLGAAGRSGEAVESWRQAARAARRNARFREAAAHERELLTLVPSLPEDQRETVEMGARSRLTMCLTAVDQNSPEAMAESRRVQELARRTGDRQTLLRSLMVALPWWQANADYRAIDEILPEAQQLATDLQDAWSVQTLAQFAGAARIWEGRVEQGLALLEASFEAVGVPLGASLSILPPQELAVAEIVLTSTRIVTALGCWLNGRIDDGHRLRDDTLQFAADRAVPQAQAVGAATAAIMAQLDGDRELVLRLTDETVRASDEVSTRQWRQWATVQRWWAGASGEEPEIPGPLLRPYFLTLVADRHGMDIDRGLTLVDEAWETARRTGEEFCVPEIWRVRGALARRRGALDDAGDSFQSAAESARAMHAPVLELRALTEWADLPGAPPEVRAGLAALVEQLASGGTIVSLGRARAVLERRS